MESVRAAAALLRDAGAVVVFTGAGMSAESGIPTFRDSLTGLWARFSPEELATPEAFEKDPELVWSWYEWRRAAVEKAAPNAGHEAVAEIGGTLITQNVDDLHERAGSADPIHLHGSLFAPRCFDCGRATTGAVCAECGGRSRPGVVWFGEQLPAAALARAVEAAESCDLLITVGTSGLVYPAAEIPHVAAVNGAAVIQVNPRPTPLDEVAAVNLRGTAATLLPAILREATG
ncbi:SIR2 family NAD-dependent protein deacylase [Paractinoplanes atraurantiacus]|uniref:NAD-dependent protein deacylase n=1 Tax=Paractinoplanes atraurantiacus TaxID=1036182 RepID=A0A285JZ94_9ACTN|nr:NAD-dependent deacylase [Actinoplanes atraurantiacus]SNY65654.1 NAD-dependent deacetylase [Actinoplanes atraurantiacus]